MLTKAKTRSPACKAPIFTQKFRFNLEVCKNEYQVFPVELGFVFWIYWRNLTQQRFFCFNILKEVWNKMSLFKTLEEFEKEF